MDPCRHPPPQIGRILIWILLDLAILGIFTGFLAGLLGVGGGLVLIPILTYMFHNALGLETPLAVKMAIATGMSTIVVTSLASTRMHHQLGAVRWGPGQRPDPWFDCGQFDFQLVAVRVHQWRCAGLGVCGLCSFFSHANAARPQTQTLA